MDEKLQDKAWKSLPEEYKKEVKRAYYNIVSYGGYSARTTMDNLFWLFGVHNLTEDEAKEEKAKQEKKERELLKKLKAKYE